MCALLFLVFVSRAVEGGAATATIFSTVCLVLFGALAGTGSWFLLRARPVLVIDRAGVVFCRAEISLEWDEIAAVSIQSWQSNFDLSQRLVLRAVHTERFDARWKEVSRGFGFTGPSGGRISLMLNFLSPSSKRIAEAIREHSDRRFAAEVRKVARRPLRDPELDA